MRGGAVHGWRSIRDIRNGAGLVYSISSYIDAGRTRAIYMVDYACDPSNVSKVRNAVVRELHAMRTTPVTADELQRAKAMLLRRTTLRESSRRAIARGRHGSRVAHCFIAVAGAFQPARVVGPYAMRDGVAGPAIPVILSKAKDLPRAKPEHHILATVIVQPNPLEPRSWTSKPARRRSRNVTSSTPTPPACRTE